MRAKLLAWVDEMSQAGGQIGMMAPMLGMALAAMSEADVAGMVKDLRAMLAALDGE